MRPMCVLALFVTQVLMAQTYTGSISGKVTDAPACCGVQDFAITLTVK